MKIKDVVVGETYAQTGGNGRVEGHFAQKVRVTGPAVRAVDERGLLGPASVAGWDKPITVFPCVIIHTEDGTTTEKPRMIEPRGFACTWARWEQYQADRVVALLNDLFGIQARGGCSCAGEVHLSIEQVDALIARLGGDGDLVVGHCVYCRQPLRGSDMGSESWTVGIDSKQYHHRCFNELLDR